MEAVRAQAAANWTGHPNTAELSVGFRYLLQIAWVAGGDANRPRFGLYLLFGTHPGVGSNFPPLPWTFLEQPKLPLPLASAAPLGALRARGEGILYLPGESGEKDPGRKQLTGGASRKAVKTPGVG